jgi:hypothetical protein
MGKTIPMIVIFLMLFYGLAYNQEYAEQNNKFVYDEFIKDKDIIEKTIQIVKDYVEKKQKEEKGYLIFEDIVSKAKRKFKLVEVFDVVSRKDDIYTVQVDVDIVSSVERNADYFKSRSLETKALYSGYGLLFFDIENQNGNFKLIKIRFGGYHLRQKFM